MLARASASRGEAALAAYDPGGLEILAADLEAFRGALTAESHTLKRALTEKVTAFRVGMAVHGRFGKPCPVCGTPVQRLVYAEGRLLADRALSLLLPRRTAVSRRRLRPRRGQNLNSPGRQPTLLYTSQGWIATPEVRADRNGLAASETTRRCTPSNRCRTATGRLYGPVPGIAAKVMSWVEDHPTAAELHLRGRALIMRGIFAGYQGKAEEAVHLIRQGLSSIDESRDPGLAFSAVQAEVRFQMDCGRFREARRALWELRRRRPDAGGRLNELKVRWLEAQISAGLEELDRAELALRLVKEGYEEAGLPFKAALAGFELGAVLLRRDRFAEATEVVLECAGVFLSLKIVRELLGTILILQSACRKGKLTLGLLGDVIARMRELERDPAGRLQSAIERQVPVVQQKPTLHQTVPEDCGGGAPVPNCPWD